MIHIPYVCYLLFLQFLYIIGIIPLELLPVFNEQDKFFFIIIHNVIFFSILYIKAKKNNSVDLGILSTIGFIIGTLPYINQLEMLKKEKVIFCFTNNIHTPPISILFLISRLIILSVYLIYKI